MIALLGSTALALTLSACKVDNRPLLARNGPAPAYAAAPAYAGNPLGPLDPAEPARVVPVQGYDGYALAERAYAYDRVAYRSQPDYGFDYRGEQPWAWQTANDDLMFAEPIDDGYRFYYYEPGETQPYFVRDPQYGYAYGDNGVLQAVFSAAGALLGTDQLYGMAPLAGQYLSRGRDLRQVYYAEPRYPLSEPVWYDRWEDRAPVVTRAFDPWMTAADRTPTWREYRVATASRELRAFEPERLRRERDVEKFERKMAKADEKAWRKAARHGGEAAMAYGPAPRHDNGLHLGEVHGRHEGRARGEGPRQFAEAGPAPRFERHEDRGGPDRGDRGGKDHGGGGKPGGDKGHGEGGGHGGGKGHDKH